MKIRARIKGTGQLVEGALVCINGEPKIFLLDKYNRQYVYGIYMESIEFLLKGEWKNTVEGLDIICEYFGEGTVPSRLLEYYKKRVRERKAQKI